MLKNTKRVMARYRKLARLAVFKTDVSLQECIRKMRIRDQAAKLIELELDRLGRKAGEK